jgi:predicted Rossmann-fold nucleotide-binding protein
VLGTAYWAPLLGWLDGAVAAGFVAPDHRALILEDDDLDSLLGRFERWRPPRGRWIAPERP